MGDLDDAARAVDRLVPNEESLANQVMPDRGRLTTWVGILFAACAVVLVPWTVYVALSLPSQAQAAHYDLAWAGFDTMLLLTLGATALNALRRSRFLTLTSSWCAALLVADAWFDVVTSDSSGDVVVAVAMAVLVELPLAGACIWLGWRSESVAEQRLRLLTRR